MCDLECPSLVCDLHDPQPHCRDTAGIVLLRGRTVYPVRSPITVPAGVELRGNNDGHVTGGYAGSVLLVFDTEDSANNVCACNRCIFLHRNGSYGMHVGVPSLLRRYLLFPTRMVAI